MITITKRLEFDAGHRLLKHEGKCAHVHGHRYAVEVEVAAPVLDTVGRVIDFSVVKEKVGGWIDTYLDHGFIAQEGDPIISFLRANAMKHYIMGDPPTAENLAALLYGTARVLLDPLFVMVQSITVYETPTSRAVYTNP